MPMNKKHWVKCPECKERLQRNAQSIAQHYLDAHDLNLTEAEAYRVASPQSAGRAPYAEDVKKNYKTVQGGAPGLGKRK